MICRITGRVVGVSEHSVVLDVGGMCYDVLTPRAALGDVVRLNGEEITVHTFQYIEGNPTASNFIPRLIGFLAESDRDFFLEFTKVKGVGYRKALRAMSLPPHQIAAAIERADEKLLTSLPEIGKKMAAQIITDLRGKLARFVSAAPTPMPLAELTDAQKVALEILVQWGDRRADAQRLVAAAVERDPSLSVPEDIVRAAYKIKQSGAA